MKISSEKVLKMLSPKDGLRGTDTLWFYDVSYGIFEDKTVVS